MKEDGVETEISIQSTSCEQDTVTMVAFFSAPNKVTGLDCHSALHTGLAKDCICRPAQSFSQFLSANSNDASVSVPQPSLSLPSPGIRHVSPKVREPPEDAESALCSFHIASSS